MREVDEMGKDRVRLGAKVSWVTGRQKRHDVLSLSLYIKKDGMCAMFTGCMSLLLSRDTYTPAGLLALPLLFDD